MKFLRSAVIESTDTVGIKRAGLWGLLSVSNEFLRQLALRCLAIARDCTDQSVKAKLFDLSEELIRKASENEGTAPPPFTLPPLSLGTSW